MMTLRPQKRIRSSEDDFERDRLSELPDDVILHILSCMPIIDVVRTVLLRRFGNLWTLVDSLKFDMSELSKHLCQQESDDHMGRVCCFIRNVLILHQNLSIDRFHICLNAYSGDEVDEADEVIRLGLRFALGRRAREIRVYDKSDLFYSTSSILPKLTSQFLVTLDLLYFEFEGESQVELRSLKKLSLNLVRMSDENFQRFISGCPLLQELVIVNPRQITKLSVTAPNIEKLSLVLTDIYMWTDTPSLYLPKLKSLCLDIHDAYRLKILDVSSVRDINIKSLSFSTYYHCYDNLKVNKMLVKKFKGAEVFRLSRDPCELFLLEVQNLQLVRCRWKCITLELRSFYEMYLLGIYHLMTSLKHLKELVIYTTEEFSAYPTNLDRVEFPSPYVTPQLKTITLHGYWKSWNSHLQVIEFLLKGATVLEKLVIVLVERRLKQEAEEIEFYRRVSSFPRASSSASVIFA